MTPWLDDGDVVLHHGDAREQLALMPSESVHCLVTSPPFFQLRDYGVAGQIGLEATLSEWAASLVAVFNEAKRVLRHDATMWLEIGDSYADKQLAGAPWRLAFALQEAGWFLRSDCIWARLPPNPMPESVTDRPTKAHSYVFLLTKSSRYYYDADAIREPVTEPWRGNGETEQGRSYGEWKADAPRQAQQSERGGTVERVRQYHPAGRNARSVWTIPTEPTPFAHFATFPQALVERCIRAGTSEHGCCANCGAPWRRVIEQTGERQDRWSATSAHATSESVPNGIHRERTSTTRVMETTGWEPSCSCIETFSGDEFGYPLRFVVPCVVLDPFMGSGTTALVARRLNRHAIGIELNADYLAIAAKRLQQPTLWSNPA